mmetsp:Transcript_16986/g.25230  ORF Transcript_16986/g.25230 Transcript_16986/m.25230 type:complete len:109 (+) Transcript_16986:142-468(+)
MAPGKKHSNHRHLLLARRAVVYNMEKIKTHMELSYDCMFAGDFDDCRHVFFLDRIHHADTLPTASDIHSRYDIFARRVSNQFHNYADKGWIPAQKREPFPGVTVSLKW